MCTFFAFLLIIIGAIFLVLCIFMLVSPDVAAAWLNNAMGIEGWNMQNVRVLTAVAGVVGAILIISEIRPFG